ncbi:MAG: AI-2E family transporter [Burkholderiaceae bacterium]
MPLTPRQTQTALWTAVALVLALALLKLGPVLTPFIMGGIMAYALEPGVRGMTKRHIPRLLAVLIMVSITLLAALAVLLILIPIIQQEFTLIRERFPGLVAAITDNFLPWLKERFGVEISLNTDALRDWFRNNVKDFGNDVAAAVFSYAKSGWGATLQILSLIFLVPVVAVFLLMDWDHMVEALRELVPTRWREQSFALAEEVDGVFGQYLRGQLKVMMALAVFYSVGLWIAGFELWLPIGVLSGLLIAVPYLGPAISLGFALIDGMLQMGPLQGLIAVGIVYGLGQVLESFFLTPRLVGESIGLHPVAVIFSLLAFGSLFGFVGVVVALPLAAIVAVALRRVKSAYRESEFYHRDQ